MTTFSPRSMVRVAQVPVGNADGTSGSTNGSFWFLRTESTFGQVLGAGYFNNWRTQLAPGDLIAVSCTASKGGLISVVAVPATGAVTTIAAILA
jgi:hypothetical protein